MVHLSSPSAFSPHFLFTVRSNQRNRTSFTADCGESCRLTAGGATSGTSKRSKNGFQFSSKRLQTETNGPTVYPKTSFQDHEVIWLTTSRVVTVMTVDKCVHQSEGCSLLKKKHVSLMIVCHIKQDKDFPVISDVLYSVWPPGNRRTKRSFTLTLTLRWSLSTEHWIVL